MGDCIELRLCSSTTDDADTVRCLAHASIDERYIQASCFSMDNTKNLQGRQGTSPLTSATSHLQIGACYATEDTLPAKNGYLLL